MVKQKALFLDRDGIINVDHGYVSQIKDFEFNEGIFELLQLFIKHNYQLFIVTNQSGIGRKYYTLEDFHTLTHWMLEEFEKHHIKIASVHFCQHAPEETCACRKPSIGMIEQILEKYTIDLTSSWMIGDKQSDIDLAHNANIMHTVAIGERDIRNATLSFKTIAKAQRYLEENQDIIQL